MTVKRIVTDVAAERVADAHAFYRDVLDLEVVMDQGWIVTFASDLPTIPQISVMTEGGSGTPVPDVSIEDDDVDAAHRRATDAGFEIVSGIVDEPWGVRRFYVRDPFGKLVNVLSHTG